MKQMSEGVVNYIPPILEESGVMKDWVAWSNSFDKILDHPRFVAYTNNEIDELSMILLICCSELK